jgi:hypothetical protein
MAGRGARRDPAGPAVVHLFAYGPSVSEGHGGDTHA